MVGFYFLIFLGEGKPTGQGLILRHPAPVVRHVSDCSNAVVQALCQTVRRETP